VPTYCNTSRKSQKEVLPVEDFQRKYQEEEEIRHQKPELEALKMWLEEDELVKVPFAILIPTLIATTIFYIIVMRPLQYERP